MKDKTCTDCGKTKPRSEFERAESGHRTYAYRDCNACFRRRYEFDQPPVRLRPVIKPKARPVRLVVERSTPWM